MNQRVFIPVIGACLAVTKPWTFQLHNDPKNTTLMALLEGSQPGESPDWHSKLVKLPAGSRLRVERIHVPREGEATISFTMPAKRVKVASRRGQVSGRPAMIGRQVRFWAKISDVNTLTVRSVSEAEAG